MKVWIKGIYCKRKPLATGAVAEYWYDRVTGARISGVPGTAEFATSLEAIRNGHKKTKVVERSFGHLAEAYRASVDYHELKSSTRSEYDRHIDKYLMPVFGDIPLVHIRRSHMTELMSSYAGTPTLARAIKRTASTMWTYAIDGLGWLDAHPFKGMEGRRRRSKEGQAPLTETEIRRFRAANPPGARARTAFEAMLCSALRVSDAAALEAGALDDALGVVVTRKTRALVLFAPTPETQSAWAAWRERSAEAGAPIGRWAFPGGSDGHVHKRTLSEDMERAFIAAQIEDKRSHSLRYTACIRLFEAGYTYEEIAEHAGHSLAAMAKKYCDKRRRAKERARTLEGFDAG